MTLIDNSNKIKGHGTLCIVCKIISQEGGHGITTQLFHWQTKDVSHKKGGHAVSTTQLFQFWADKNWHTKILNLFITLVNCSETNLDASVPISLPKI